MTFDSDFYVTVAQILPVLVLALSIEVGLDSFFGFSGKVFDVLEKIKVDVSEDEAEQFQNYLVSWARRTRQRRRWTRLALTVSLAVALAGEAVALVALTLDSPPPALGVILLVVIAAVLALLALGLYWRIWSPTTLDARINQHDPPGDDL